MKKLLLAAVLIAVCIGLIIWIRHSGTSDRPADTTLPSNDTGRRPLEPVQPEKTPATVVAAPRSFAGAAEPNAVERQSAELPDHIQRLLDAKSAIPSSELVDLLAPSDEPLLVSLYEQETELTNRMALTWALAAVGTDQAATALQKTLTADYGQRNLAYSEREILSQATITALGFVAERSDRAYEFLQEASAVDFWSHKRTWRGLSPSEEDDADRAFAAVAMGAAGISHRPGVLERLNYLRDQDPETARPLCAGAVDAAFRYDFVESNGARILLNTFLSGQSFHRFMQWTQTENGSNWFAWCKETLRTKNGTSP